MTEFDKIIGQERAKSRLLASVKSFKRGGITLSPLFRAQKGGGKTVLADAYSQELKKAGAKLLRFPSPEEFREEGKEWDKFIQFFTESERSVMFIDEAHLLTYKATRRMDKARAAIMKSFDKSNIGKVITLDSETSFTFSRKEKTVILATNFPGRLDPSGALQSRMDGMDLDEYDNNELLEILKLMLEAEGFHHLNDGTLDIIAKCGRGSARPLEKLVSEITILLGGKKTKTITKAEVKTALRNIKLYPFGISEDELSVLQKFLTPLRSAHAAAALPKIETKLFKQAVGYLFSLKLLKPSGSLIVTSEKGKKYLEELKEHELI